MAKISVHEKDCIFLLKNPWTDVHKYLDQYAQKFPPTKYAEYHRSYLHNSYGVIIIRALFGEEAYKAALIHIYRDWTYLDPTKYKLEELINKVEKSILIYMNQFKFMELPYTHI